MGEWNNRPGERALEQQITDQVQPALFPAVELNSAIHPRRDTLGALAESLPNSRPARREHMSGNLETRPQPEGDPAQFSDSEERP